MSSFRHTSFILPGQYFFAAPYFRGDYLLETTAEKMVGRLDAQDAGATTQERCASDRGVYGRFTRALAEAEMTRFPKADLTADRFSWSVNEDAVAKAQPFDGTLALTTNLRDIGPSWADPLYKGRADIERNFRVLRSDIEIAPVHHRLPDRIRAHVLICFLALPLYRVAPMRLKAKGLGASPKAAPEILAKVQRASTVSARSHSPEPFEPSRSNCPSPKP